MRKITVSLAGLALLLGMGTPARADDVRGSDTLLCSVNLAIQCGENGECESGPPWILNLPEFLEIRLADRMITTTRTSPDPRTTPIKSLDRTDGAIFAHGDQNGRAFSFVIIEETGMATYAVATEQRVISGFGACIPHS